MVLAVGLALVETRLTGDIGRGWHLLVMSAGAALFLWLGLQTRPPSGRPAAHQSVLFVLGLAALGAALLWLARVLGVEFSRGIPAGTVTWILLVLGSVALLPAFRHESAICGFIAALAFGGALLAAVRWIFGADSPTTYRWLLLLLALGSVFASLVLRGSRPRHSELLVCAAGIAVLALALQGLLNGVLSIFGPSLGVLPTFWEAVVLAAGFGLIAYAAVDRAAGPAYVGLANLVAFVALATGSGATLRWWPVLLLVVGAVAIVAGLRPARPLPPEPDAYPVGELPPVVRAGEREVTLRVHDP